MNKLSMSDLLNKYDFNIKKKFGQNFLTDTNIIKNIVSSGDINKDVNVIEVGPGLGALTQELVESANKVLCFEIDNNLIPILNDIFSETSNLSIVNEDILKTDVNKHISEFFNDDKDIVVVANLPYYITTAILLRLLEEVPAIKRYVVMMQLEVAKRLTSPPSTKDYNSLSIVVQYRTIAKKVLNVPKTVFIPKPNVDSAVVRLDVVDNHFDEPQNIDLFYKIVRASFAQRRKTLTNNLQLIGFSKSNVSSALDKLGKLSNIRAEELSVEEFIQLSNLLNNT